MGFSLPQYGSTNVSMNFTNPGMPSVLNRFLTAVISCENEILNIKSGRLNHEKLISQLKSEERFL